MKDKKMVRQSNFELLRIVAILDIVLYHIIIHSNLLNITIGSTKIIIQLITALCLFHVNSFMLLSGYFYKYNKFKLSKILSLILQIWFYNIIITVILQLIGIVDYNKLELLIQLFPLNISSHWYLYCYIIVYALSPYLNKLIETMSNKSFKKLIIVMLLCFSILPQFTANLFYNTDGYTVIQIIMMYFVGAYINKNDIDLIKCNNIQKRFIYIILFIIFSLINFIFYYSSSYLMQTDSMIINYIANNIHKYFLCYNNILIILQSICIFMFFKNINIKSKIINYISTLVLGVYIITENYSFKHNLYDYIKTSSDAIIYGKEIILKIFIWAIIIFICSLLIEFLRKQLILLINKIKIINKLYNNFLKYLHNIFEIKEGDN